jgi:hypothetical protein
MTDGKFLVQKVVRVTENILFSFIHTTVLKGFVVRGMWVEGWSEFYINSGMLQAICYPRGVGSSIRM